MWSAEYPARVQDFIGNEKARSEMISWFKEWVQGTKPLLLIGPPGVGKTSIVHTLADQYEVDLIELNASDTRNRNGLIDRINPIMENSSLYGKKFLLFLDEVDGITPREDFGATDYLIKIMKESTVPVILAANKLNQITRDLAKASKVVSFLEIPPRLGMMFLNHILLKKNLNITPGTKYSIIKASSGDFRKLLNDAQSRISGYPEARDNFSTLDIAYAVNKFFSCVDVEAALEVILSADAVFRDPRFGLSSEDQRKDLVSAFYSSIVSSNSNLQTKQELLEQLSKVDVIMGRSMRKRNWKVLRHLPYLLTYSIFRRSRLKYLAYNRYSVGFQSIGNLYARGRGIRGALVTLSKSFHTSVPNLGSFVLPFMFQVLSNSKDAQVYIRNSLEDEKFISTIANEVSHRSRLD
jgi:replication factor C large subunit